MRRHRTTTPSQHRGAFIGKAGTLAERFWRYVEKRSAGECWLWTGTKNNCGYGTIGRGGVTPSGSPRMTTAHRVAWELYRGPIPGGMVICHRCDRPACVNPDHLFVGSQRDNVRDAIAKGRHFLPRGISRAARPPHGEGGRTDG